MSSWTPTKDVTLQNIWNSSFFPFCGPIVVCLYPDPDPDRLIKLNPDLKQLFINPGHCLFRMAFWISNSNCERIRKVQCGTVLYNILYRNHYRETWLRASVILAVLAISRSWMRHRCLVQTWKKKKYPSLSFICSVPFVEHAPFLVEAAARHCW